MNHRSTETQSEKQREHLCFDVPGCLVDPLFESARFLNAKSARFVHRKGRKGHCLFLGGAADGVVLNPGFALGTAERDMVGQGPPYGCGVQCRVGMNPPSGSLRVNSQDEAGRVGYQLRCFAMFFASFAFFVFQTRSLWQLENSRHATQLTSVAPSVILRLCGER